MKWIAAIIVFILSFVITFGAFSTRPDSDGSALKDKRVIDMYQNKGNVLGTTDSSHSSNHSSVHKNSEGQEVSSHTNGQLTCDPNGDGVIDISDFEVWKNEYLGIVEGTSSDCFDPNGVVDLLDFQAWKDAVSVSARE